VLEAKKDRPFAQTGSIEEADWSQVPRRADQIMIAPVFLRQNV
jgi:hypothetical protein